MQERVPERPDFSEFDMAFQCVVVTPDVQLFDAQVSQVILPAHDGQMGILTDRAPMLARLGLGQLRVDVAGGASQTFLVDGGVAQMKGDKLTILTKWATSVDKVDADATKAELAEATARVTTDAHGAENRLHDMNKAKAKLALVGQG